jgi:NADH dehydrogenase [ubiquinone] 1 alpha subcomplex assembly factor 1
MARRRRTTPLRTPVSPVTLVTLGALLAGAVSVGAVSAGAVSAAAPAAPRPGAAPVVPAAATSGSPAGAVRVFDFGPSEGRWYVVNDGVMGGVSDSTAVLSGGRLVFSGRVRLENNGGFASTRSSAIGADDVLARSGRLLLRVRGDGRTYQLTLLAADGSAWFWAPIRPRAGVWTTLEIPYGRLAPHGRFGQPLGTAPYDGRPVDSFGFLIGNSRAESFRLEVDWIALAP